MPAPFSKLTILELGFGAGLNFLRTWELFEKNLGGEGGLLEFISCEKTPLDKNQIQDALSPFPELKNYLKKLLNHYPIFIPNTSNHYFLPLIPGRVHLHCLWGDPIKTLKNLETQADAVFFNPPFSRERDFELVRGFLKNSNPGGVKSKIPVWFQSAVFSPLCPTGQGPLSCLSREGRDDKQSRVSDDFVSPLAGETGTKVHLSDREGGIKSIAIIGAGIAGCSMAYVLAHLGCSVTMFDPLGIAQAASGNPYGLIRPNLTVDNNSSDQFISQGAYLAINTIQDLMSQGLDLDILFDQVIQEVPELRLKKRFKDLIKNKHSAVAQISEDQYQIKPAALISPIKFCEALINSAQTISEKLGTKFNLIKQRVEKLEYKNNLWNDHFNIMIITAGSEAQRLFPEDNLNLKNSPGQISLIPVDPGRNSESFKIKIPLCYEGYCFPVINHIQLLGATYRATQNLEVSTQDHEENLNYLAKVNPVLADQLRHSEIKSGRVSVRTSSPDHLPLVGSLIPEKIFKTNYSRLAYGDQYAKYPEPKDWPGLFLSTGHGSKGLSTSLISAWTIASQIFNLTLPVPVHIYSAVHPARFWVRELKRG